MRRDALCIFDDNNHRDDHNDEKKKKKKNMIAYQSINSCPGISALISGCTKVLGQN